MTTKTEHPEPERWVTTLEAAMAAHERISRYDTSLSNQERYILTLGTEVLRLKDALREAMRGRD